MSLKFLSKDYALKIMIVFLLISFTFVRVEADNTSHRILLITDSHGLGPYGEKLDQLFRTIENSHSYTYAIGGTAPWQWINPYTRWVSSRSYIDSGKFGESPLPSNRENIKKTKTPMFKDLLTSLQNLSGEKYVVISLGSNHQHTDWGLNFLKNNVSKMVKMVEEFNYHCLWIGPPKMRRWDRRGIDYYRITIDTIREGLGERCEYFDSTLVTNYPSIGGDGVHYANTPEHRKVAFNWALQVFETFQNGKLK